MRKILRRIAHARMRKAGYRRVNMRGTGGMDGRSYFAVHWREWT